MKTPNKFLHIGGPLDGQWIELPSNLHGKEYLHADSPIIGQDTETRYAPVPCVVKQRPTWIYVDITLKEQEIYNLLEKHLGITLKKDSISKTPQRLVCIGSDDHVYILTLDNFLRTIHTSPIATTEVVLLVYRWLLEIIGIENETQREIKENLLKIYNHESISALCQAAIQRRLPFKTISSVKNSEV